MTDIVRATRADLPRMMEINKVSMPETYVPAFWTNHLNQFGDMMFVAKVDGKIVGYIMCRETMVNSIRTGLVISVAIDSNYRRRGIADELMKSAHFAMRQRNIPLAALQVRKSNEGAIALYKKIGYAIRYTIPGYYTNPDEDGYLMDYVL